MQIRVSKGPTREGDLPALSEDVVAVETAKEVSGGRAIERSDDREDQDDDQQEEEELRNENPSSDCKEQQ
jgi:hypothetical protein